MIRHYKAIKDHNLFDSEFYLSSYPKVRDSKMDPLIHYLFFGYLEGKKPFKDFDIGFYSYHYNIEGNPLVHYATVGKRKGYSYKLEDIDLKTLNEGAPLFVLHEKITNLGGASLSIFDVIKTLDLAYILTSNGEDVELWKYDSRLEKIKNWPVGYKSDFSLIDDNETIIADNYESIFYNNDLAIIYDEILSKLDISFVHVNHLINHSFDLFESITKNNIPYLISIHDFYYICPSIHLLNENMEFCRLDCTNNCGISIDDKGRLPEIIEAWREMNEKVLSQSAVNIVPSKSTADIYNQIFPEMDNFQIIEPGRDLDILKHDSYFNQDRIRIFIPGHISPHKGSLLIKQIKELDSDNRIDLHLAGTTIPNLNDYGVNHGRYDRDDFNSLVQEIKPRFIAILSNCPETYSHTLTEAIAARVPVITTNLGALKERVQKDNVGWALNPDPREIYEKILAIDETEYNKKAKNLSKVRLPKHDEMLEEYNKIYSKMG